MKKRWLCQRNATLRINCIVTCINKRRARVVASSTPLNSGSNQTAVETYTCPVGGRSNVLLSLLVDLQLARFRPRKAMGYYRIQAFVKSTQLTAAQE